MTRVPTRPLRGLRLKPNVVLMSIMVLLPFAM